MRILTALSFVLLLPSISSAQTRQPDGGATDIARPAPLGREPIALSRSEAFVRSRLSVEAYPLASRVVVPRLSDGAASSWTSFGTGGRVAWQTTRYMSLSLDLTSAYLGGESLTATAEAGVRLRPEQWQSRLRPFADARIAFEQSAETYPLQSPLGIGPELLQALGSLNSRGLEAVVQAPRSRTSRGVGAVVGGGVDFGVTNTFAFTSGLWAMRSRMAADHLTGVSDPAGGLRFSMTTYRLTLGLKYNPVYSRKS